MLASLGSDTQQLLLQVLFPMGHLSPTLFTSTGDPFAFTIHFATLMQEWPKIIVGTHCCATLVLDHIFTTMTYVMWYEHIWNISVLQTVHLSIHV